MRFLRSLLLFIYFIAFTMPYAMACFVAFPFMRADKRYWMAVGWCRATLAVARHLTGIRYRVEGLENLPDGPAVLLSKHQSAWETVALPAMMPRPLCFVFKRELLYVPFFGWALGMLHMVHINRKDGKYAFASVVKQGRLRMSEGAWVIMFPEGTRTPVGQQGKYKTGGARFAVDAGAPVVPIAHNAGHVWPRNSFIKYPGLVTVSIGKPIATEGLTPEQVNTRVETWIENEMRRIDPDAYRDSGGDAGANAAGRRSTDSAGTAGI
ncbi:lysophospholipid acyltransferase family protein [Trinickia caryophylli]|uniref:1-acyl-sn-glycerol-3-phosphate acyltransferase n=1 Tax=Trinickia caryophylli TaxID=28094 RepID=A0A1X7ET30_TRICW|nr:lysophospholipid acyltransferase family protein [Trinickia caryophylli]PMS12131.1 1-acyl-sn-glycerol-3-phosphate acyltransferase [Trinickia caryophylli]TRX18561.1 1-acyl-sn-glycerol-3-phosphate acyltransferase [Trinickia caryophylli]WQE10646.1 lysophospholipid acyltransferase family protein [Trinickia caryophylli]SMF39696.1 1-acyl-sn-glycerol-3-phosphate acyltransferase [Trinickia caryophylli]GLU33013.1 1-acyl-sn-glycerol-3-phosphate acyltransferase [Trinickia caryophylli]